VKRTSGGAFEAAWRQYAAAVKIKAKKNKA
jgi:hypothetical protein